MKQLPRLFILLSSLFLLLTFFFPLWGIDLWAPQYPEGLSMELWSSKITGDVRNLNILNHYIGMAPIHPEDFWELRYFPYVIAALSLTGALVSIFNKRSLLTAWVVTLLFCCFLAFYDFYAWESKFGSNLNPDAPIKVEGMSYAPPLIGTKRLLNIEVWSLPEVGGYGVLASSVFAMGGLVLNLRKRVRE